MVEQLQVIAASMAGAGQLVAGSVDLMYLVALAFDGHGGTGELVLGPGSAGGHGTRTSRDLDAREGGLLLARRTVGPLQVIAASMASAGQLVAGSVDLMYLVVLAFDGHGGTGELVLGPDRAGGHGTRTSRDLDAREGSLLLARGERSSSCR